MAARSTAQAGNFSATSTWVGGVIPVDGDTITQTHDLVIDVNATIGVDGIAANHHTISGAANLTIAEDVKYTIRGYGYHNSTGSLIMQPGSTLEMNSTAASRYHLATTAAKIVFNGTAAKPCTIKKGGTGFASITGGNLYGGLQGQHVIFNGLSDASGFSISNKALATNGGYDLQYVTFDGCGKNSLSASADGNWSLQTVTEKNNVGRDFIDGTTVIAAATTGSRVLKKCVSQKFINFGNASMTGFVITDNVFKERFFEGHGTISEWKNNFFYVEKTAYPSFGQLLDAKANGLHEDTYFLSANDFQNPHFVNYGDFTADVGCEWRRPIFEALHPTDASGDGILNNPTAQRTNTLTCNVNGLIVIPSAGGKASCAPVTIAKYCRGVSFKVNHCTYFVGGSSGADVRAVVIERGATNGYGGQNVITEMKSNIAWDNVVSGGFLLSNIPDTVNGEVDSGTATGGSATTLDASSKTWANNIFTVASGAGQYFVRLTSGAYAGSVGTISSNTGTQLTVSSWSSGAPSNGDTFRIFCVDPVTPGGVSHNCGLNLSPGEYYDATGAKVGSGLGNGYHQFVGSSPLGSTDIHVDPQFVDKSRNISTWDASLGGPGTAANAISELSKINDTDHNPAYTAQALIAYVRGGYSPQNALLRNAGHDSVTMGAVEFATAASWEVWTEPMLADKPQPTYNPATKNTSISLSGAKNEWVGFLLCVRGTGTLSGFVPSMSVTLSNGSETIADSNVIPYILYNHTTTERANAYEVPGVYPDAAVPYRDVYYNEVRDGVKAGWGQVFAENTTRAFFVEIYIPTATAHGAYTGTFRLTSNSGTLTRDIPISLNVWDFELPSQWSLKNVWGVHGPHWILDGTAFGGRNDAKAREYLFNMQKAAINHGFFLYGNTGRKVSGPTIADSFTDQYFDGANDAHSWKHFLDGDVPQGYNPKPYPRTSVWCSRDESGGPLIGKPTAVMDLWKTWITTNNYDDTTLFIDKIIDEPTLSAINAKHADHVTRHSGEPDRPMEFWTASSLAYPKDSAFWTDEFKSAWMVSQLYTWYRAYDWGSAYGSPADFDARIAQYGDLLFSYTAGDNDSACNIATYNQSRGIRAAASSSLDAYSRQNAYMLISDWHFGTIGHHFWMTNQGWGYDVVQGVADDSGNFSIPIPHILANGTYQIIAYWVKGDGTTGLLSGASTIVSSASNVTTLALPLTSSTVGPNVTVTGATTIPGVTVRIYIAGTVSIDSANYVWSCTDPFGDFKMQNGYGGTGVQAYNGDGVYFYPGRVSGTDYDIGGTHEIPIESFKLKLVRWGAQVYEYAKLLADSGHKAIADAQVARMITFNVPNTITIHPVSEFDDARLTMGTQKAAQLSHINTQPTGSVTISGTPTQGQTLTASNTLADADGIGGITYAWQADGIPLSTGSSISLTAAEIGKNITVIATYTDGYGAAESVTSAPVGPVVPAQHVNTPPTGSITISGAPTEGETLTVVDTLADADGIGPRTYTWKFDGSGSAVGSTYVLTASEVDKSVTVTATYTDGYGVAESVISAQVGPVLPDSEPEDPEYISERVATIVIPCSILCNEETGEPLGFIGADGREYPSVFGRSFGKSGHISVTHIDMSSLPGDCTINEVSGSASFAQGTSSVTVTCDMCSNGSIVIPVLVSNDATLKTLSVETRDGSFVISGNAPATAVTRFKFFIVN